MHTGEPLFALSTMRSGQPRSLKDLLKRTVHGSTQDQPAPKLNMPCSQGVSKPPPKPKTSSSPTDMTEVERDASTGAMELDAAEPPGHTIAIGTVSCCDVCWLAPRSDNAALLATQKFSSTQSSRISVALLLGIVVSVIASTY
jgi:hypothetical protein